MQSAALDEKRQRVRATREPLTAIANQPSVRRVWLALGIVVAVVVVVGWLLLLRSQSSEDRWLGTRNGGQGGPPPPV
jgi:hypothetical protein